MAIRVSNPPSDHFYEIPNAPGRNIQFNVLGMNFLLMLVESD